MQSIYTSYECNSCKKESVLIIEELSGFKGYLQWPYCSSKRQERKAN
ncbi:hypothetical protein CSC2_09360 [Clostridium zeae]|uniref:Uncharacterized protein n=1 Tax=Clostridium zeae TaxID=2759022 RepID=A0ABQ1E6K5_9CLOT|nr:hypothetical protein [Clostridium zeae]GFZ30410.1 hypothetical protein CSC2_09360 [Clostridium zeae]